MFIKQLLNIYCEIKYDATNHNLHRPIFDSRILRRSICESILSTQHLISMLLSYNSPACFARLIKHKTCQTGLADV